MDETLEVVRSFNRFFTKFVGALDANFLGTKMTLSEARVLFEINARRSPTATEIGAALDMDPGYLSRVLRRFEADDWIERTADAGDRRRQTIALRRAGKAAFRAIDTRQRKKVEEILQRLTPYERRDLAGALNLSRVLLAGSEDRSFALRSFRAGDMGLISARQSLVYRETYGWGPAIEVNIGEVTAAFLRDFKPGREQCWVAEVGGVMAGSVFLTDEGDGLCRLRLLYVEPFARGRGIASALVDTCLRFARSTGYDTMTLWTHTILASARRIYAANGFKIVHTETHTTFGMPLDGETWRLDLRASA